MPLGRFLPGFLISSAIAATLVTPAYATNTSAAVSPKSHTSELKAASAGADISASPENNAAIDSTTSNNTENPTIGACIAFIFLTPRIFTITINTSTLKDTDIELNSTSKKLVIAYIYAVNPINANEAFNRNDAQSPIPAIVPSSGPYVRSMYTYVPPDVGIADANSDFETAPGNTTVAARTYANQIPAADAPIVSAAIEGRTNNPEPSIAESEIIITPTKPIVRSNCLETSEITPLTSP